MVHVSTPRPSIGEALGKVLGSAGAGYANRYVRQQQQIEEESKLKAALGEAEKIYSDTSFTPEQKELGLYQALYRQPQIAQALARSGLQREEYGLKKSEIERKSKEQKAKEDLERTAAQEAGYTYGVPATVAAKQVEGKQKEEHLNKFYGDQNPPRNVSPNENQPLNNNAPQSPFDFMSKTQLQQATGSPYKEISEPAKAKLQELTEREKLDQKRDLAIEERYGKRNDEIMKRIDDETFNLPKQQATLNLMKEAVANRDLGFWTKDNLAEVTGASWLRTPEGALFKAQAKQYFLGDLERIKGRANQLLEKQILDAQAKVGQSTGTNLSVMRSEQMRLDLKKAEIDVANRIIDSTRGAKNEPHNLAKMISDQLVPIAENIETDTLNDLIAISSIEENVHKPFHKVEKGTVASDYLIQALLKRHKNDQKKVEDELDKLGYVE